MATWPAAHQSQHRVLLAYGDAPTSTRTATKAIAGLIIGPDGAPFAGALVVLFLVENHTYIAQTTSGTDGSYRFARNHYDARPYFIAAWAVNGTDQQSLSVRTLTAE